MTLLLDPKLFNYIIMTLYTCACLWWAAHGSWTDAAYWFFALGITATVTWGYGR
jgi:hypothetical protein